MTVEEFPRKRGRPAVRSKPELLIGPSAKKFQDWLASAKPGETYEYNRGEWAGESGAAPFARIAMNNGYVILYQQRVADKSEFRYMAKRTQKK